MFIYLYIHQFSHARTIEFWKAFRADEKVTCIGLSVILDEDEEKSFLFGARVDGKIYLLRGIGGLIFHLYIY